MAEAATVATLADASPAAEQPPQINCGSLVVLHSLTSDGALNGQLGIADAFNEASGRFAVSLVSSPKRTVHVLPAKLAPWAHGLAWELGPHDRHPNWFLGAEVAAL